jgi:hypothetical protein
MVTFNPYVSLRLDESCLKLNGRIDRLEPLVTTIRDSNHRLLMMDRITIMLDIITDLKDLKL